MRLSRKLTLFMSGRRRLASPEADCEGVAWAALSLGCCAAAAETGAVANACALAGRTKARAANISVTAAARRRRFLLDEVTDERMTRPIRPDSSQVCICVNSSRNLVSVDFSINHAYWQFPKRASTSRKLRGFEAWPRWNRWRSEEHTSE